MGRLKPGVPVSGIENQLIWTGLNKDFFDTSQFAGEGNIGHMIEQVKLWKEKIWCSQL